MRPDELAARSREIAAENERGVLQALVNAGDAGLVPGRELAELVGVPESTTRAVLGRLVSRRLATRQGRARVWATTAGRSEAAAGVSGVSLGSALDAAIGAFPSETLRAFIRLMLSAVIARWHLAGEYDGGWPGFISAGPTGTGKTSVAQLVCRIFGLSELEAIQSAFRETPGPLIGRRLPDGASSTRWRVERSQAMALPFVCVDEWDKASREVQQAAGGLLLGATADQLEGARVELRPVVYVTLNTGVAGLRVLHAAHVRRSVVIDTTPLKPLLDDLDRVVRRIKNGQLAVPRLHLEQLRPPAPALPDDLWELLRTELREGLTDEGWAHSDVEPLARIALGHAALAVPLDQAVLTTVYDYLSCADTLGHARDGYAARLAPQLGDGALVPDPDAAQRQREQLYARRFEREIERAVDRKRLVAERGYLEQMLNEKIATLDLRKLKYCSPQQRMAAWSLAEVLRDVRADVTSASTEEGLEIAKGCVRDPVQLADRLHEEIEREAATRANTIARLGPASRSRRPELAPARATAGVILKRLQSAHGQELDALHHEAQQLELSPPVTEADRLQSQRALQARELYNYARMNNRYG